MTEISMILFTGSFKRNEFQDWYHEFYCDGKGRRDLFPNHVHKFAERPPAINELYEVATATSYIFVYCETGSTFIPFLLKMCIPNHAQQLCPRGRLTLVCHMKNIQNTEAK